MRDTVMVAVGLVCAIAVVVFLRWLGAALDLASWVAGERWP